MPRYFFDTHDGRAFMRDEEGSVCRDFATARREAMCALPEIARFAMPKEGDHHQGCTVLVRNEAGVMLYSATLTFAGLRLNSEANRRASVTQTIRD